MTQQNHQAIFGVGHMTLTVDYANGADRTAAILTKPNRNGAEVILCLHGEDAEALANTLGEITQAKQDIDVLLANIDRLTAEEMRLRTIIGQVNSINDDPACFNDRIDKLVRDFPSVVPPDIAAMLGRQRMPQPMTHEEEKVADFLQEQAERNAERKEQE